jgi:hypothetical protein
MFALLAITVAALLPVLGPVAQTSDNNVGHLETESGQVEIHSRPSTVRGHAQLNPRPTA